MGGRPWFAPEVETVALFFALFPAVVVIFLRHAVLRQRQRAIFELDFAFSLSRTGNLGAEMTAIPAFEYVKMKYNLRNPKAEIKLKQLASENPANNAYEVIQKHWDFTLSEWILGFVPMFIFLYFTGQFIIIIIVRLVLDQYFSGHELVIALTKSFMPDANFSTDAIWPETKWVDGISLPIQWALCSAFVGAYLNMFVTMFRCVNNFDLGPATFIESTGTIFLGMTVGMIAFYFFDVLAGQGSAISQLTGANPQATVAVLVPFIAAFFPGPIRRWVFKSNILRIFDNIKRESNEFDAFTATSVEVIDGIDSTIRERLEDFHIYSVQNLAAANPLMLYVETPYGVYEIVDWVAQAQLFSAFGSTKVGSLWKIGIRTIFDLERFVLDPACRDIDLLERIGGILLESKKDGNDAFKEGTLKAVILSILEASHVHRLRQVFLTLYDAVGAQARRFPDIPLKCVNCVKQNG